MDRKTSPPTSTITTTPLAAAAVSNPTTIKPRALGRPRKELSSNSASASSLASNSSATSASSGAGSISSSSSTSSNPLRLAAQLRVQKDLADLNMPDLFKFHFDNIDNLLEFTVTVSPREGHYMGGQFPFSVSVPISYPYEPPKVRCKKVIFHPNIDTRGNVCLNLLREDWNPILNMGSVLLGLLHLFLEPNPDDPLNKFSADILRTDLSQFKMTVYRSMRGAYMDSVKYDAVTGRDSNELP